MADLWSAIFVFISTDFKNGTPVVYNKLIYSKIISCNFLLKIYKSGRSGILLCLILSQIYPVSQWYFHIEKKYG